MNLKNKTEIFLPVGTLLVATDSYILLRNSALFVLQPNLSRRETWITDEPVPVIAFTKSNIKGAKSFEKFLISRIFESDRIFLPKSFKKRKR